MTRPTFSRLPLLAAGALALALGTIPVLAGPAEDAQLAAYAGNYLGTGTISGAHAQNVKCRLVLNASSGTGKVAYTGRCSANGADFSLTGTFAYVNGKYVAAMSGGGASGEVVGQKSGSSIVFRTAKQHSTMGGQAMTVSSTLTLSGGGKITVQFNTTDDKTGASSSGTIPFTKS